MIQLLVVLFYSIVFTSAQAEQALLQVDLSETAPFAYAEDGAIRGTNVDILNALSEKAGIKFSYKLYPHIRLANSLDILGTDLTILFSKSCLKFKNKYEVQANLYTPKPTLFLKKSLSLKSEKLRIGIIRGTCLGLSEKLLSPEMITDISDMHQATEMLAAGRLEGVCGLGPVVKFSLEQNSKFHEKLFPVHTDSEVLQAVLCRKKSLSPEVKKKLDLALKKVKIPTID